MRLGRSLALLFPEIGCSRYWKTFVQRVRLHGCERPAVWKLSSIYKIPPPSSLRPPAFAFQDKAVVISTPI